MHISQGSQETEEQGDRGLGVAEQFRIPESLQVALPGLAPPTRTIQQSNQLAPAVLGLCCGILFKRVGRGSVNQNRKWPL